MSVETALYPTQLNTAWPQSVDFLSEGDDHIRLNKIVTRTTWPNVAGAVSASHTELSYMTGVTSSVQTQFDAKGAIAGQTWTGTHVFPSTTTIGPLTPTKQTYLATITSDVQVQIDGKASAGGQVWTGTHNFTGATVTAPTRTAGDNTTNIATTAFVTAAGFSSSLPGQTGNAGKSIMTDGTSASWDFPQFKEPTVALAGSGTIDLALGGSFSDTLSADRTFTVSNATVGSVFTLELNKTAGNITLPSGSVWANGTTPTLANGKRHLLFFKSTQVGTAGWYVSALTGYA